MDLFLVRHAIAYDRDPSRWPDDSDRPLTERGVRRFQRVARRLRALAPRVDASLTSPLCRARQTAGLLEEAADWPSPSILEALAPECSPAEMLEALMGHAGARAVALVGHAPNLDGFASFLLTGSEATPVLELKKGGVARLQFPNDVRPGGARLRWLLTPRAVLDLSR